MVSLQKNTHDMAISDEIEKKDRKVDDIMDESLGSISSADEKEMEMMLLGEHTNRFEAQ